MKDKIEVIIYSGDKIMIQDITLERVEKTYHQVLRIPTPEELAKISNACTNSINNTGRD